MRVYIYIERESYRQTERDLHLPLSLKTKVEDVVKLIRIDGSFTQTKYAHCLLGMNIEKSFVSGYILSPGMRYPSKISWCSREEICLFAFLSSAEIYTLTTVSETVEDDRIVEHKCTSSLKIDAVEIGAKLQEISGLGQFRFGSTIEYHPAEFLNMIDI